jgi:hypothetical protein
MSDIMVCYGKDNNGKAYGGGIIYGSKYIYIKPCYLNILSGDGNSFGIVYIYFNNSVVSYYRQSGNEVIRVIIYGR